MPEPFSFCVCDGREGWVVVVTIGFRPHGASVYARTRLFRWSTNDLIATVLPELGWPPTT